MLKTRVHTCGPLCLIAALLALGCGSRDQERPIGEGFVASATLNLRKELGPRQPSVATVKHGERLEILARRRRFVKARTSSGAVGWTDGALLFGPEQMEELRALGRWAKELPSQGEATVLDTLNAHTAPSRQAPSFQQIREGQHVAVVGHRAVREGTRADDWSLVRLSDREAGWALTRMLVMALPDEVAQYAEGDVVTSYFALDDVIDRGVVKKNWLWTATSKRAEPYDFDSVRMFVWSTRRHRYETSYIERNLKGYYPVEIHPQTGSPPGFSLIVEERDGNRNRRRYAFQGFRVRLIGRSPAGPSPEPPRFSTASAEGSSREAPARRSFLGGLRERVAAAWSRWSNK